ncbi:MAG: hypothetical protein L6R37_006286 [Teloschistes peruensis]|nr:MAG: hypothetical protein L6R37_006286 [Teloschistes peruensis]
MPGLPTSGFAVWQKASVSAVDFGDDGETFSQVRLVLMCNAGFSPLQAIMIWVPYTKTNGQWIASKILQGFFGAPIESLCEISVTDLYFTHERGSYIALYGFALLSSSYLAPVLAGFINDGQGWEWVLVGLPPLLANIARLKPASTGVRFSVVLDSDVEKTPHLAQTENLNGGRTLQPKVDPDSPHVPMLYTGRFGDWLVLRMARKNNGIMEPEYRLWLFSPSILLLPGGLILWGVGAAHQVHWFGLVVAMGTLGFTSGLGLQLSISYCIDSYRELSGEAVVTVILIRNTMSFAIGYGITPWVTNLGLQNAFVVAAMAGLVQTLCFLVFVRYGRHLRRATADKYRDYAAEMAAAGLTD